MRKLKQLFCKHEYTQTMFVEEYEQGPHGLRYSRRLYKCKKCNKEIWVDGRWDKYRR